MEPQLPMYTLLVMCLCCARLVVYGSSRMGALQKQSTVLFSDCARHWGVQRCAAPLPIKTKTRAERALVFASYIFIIFVRQVAQTSLSPRKQILLTWDLLHTSRLVRVFLPYSSRILGSRLTKQNSPCKHCRQRLWQS